MDTILTEVRLNEIEAMGFLTPVETEALVASHRALAERVGELENELIKVLEENYGPSL